jgi:hypothetical protein
MILGYLPVLEDSKFPIAVRIEIIPESEMLLNFLQVKLSHKCLPRLPRTRWGKEKKDAECQDHIKLK